VRDVQDHALEIGSDLFDADTDRLNSSVAQPFIASKIRLHRGFEIVRQSIHLNGKPGSFAIEVQNERPDWMLPTEPQSFRSQPKGAPKSDFRGTHALPKFASLADRQDPSTSFAGPPPREIAGRL
jgi:hypothetical protein